MGNEKKTIDVVPAVLSNVTPESFSSWAKQNNFDVVMPSIEEAFNANKDKLGDMPIDQFKQLYSERVVPFYQSVRNEEWTHFDMSNLIVRHAGNFWDENQFTNRVYTPETKEIKKSEYMQLGPGVSLKTFTKQELAEDDGTYFTLDGTKKGIGEHSMFDGTVLDVKQDLSTGKYYYQEVPLGEASSDFRGVFGPKPLTKSFDAARGLYNVLPGLIESIGHFAEVGVEMGTALQANEDWDIIKKTRAIQNVGKGLMTTAEEDSNSGLRLYDVANGIGQLAEMVGVGYLTGGTYAAARLGAMGSKSALGAFQKGVGQKVLKEFGERKAIDITSGMAKVSKNAALFTGAIQAAGAWKGAARDMGIPDDDAALMYLGIAAISTAVEAGIGPNKFLNIFDDELIKPSMEAVAKTYLKEAQKQGLGSIKELFKNDRKAAIKIGLNAFKETAQALAGKVKRLDTIPGGSMIQGGAEEGFEEWYEAIGHGAIEATYDFIAPFLNEKMKRGLDLKTGDGLFGTNFSEIFNADIKELGSAAIAGAFGGAFMGSSKAKNEATKHITKIFAEQGDGAAGMLRDEITHALNLVKAGKSSWLDQAYLTEQGEIAAGATPVERAEANAQVLMGLVNMVDNVFQSSDLKQLVNDAKTETDVVRRGMLMDVLENQIIPEALLGNTAELVYAGQIAQLEKSDDPDKANKIAELQGKITDAKQKASVKWSNEAKRSPYFDVVFNDIYAQTHKEDGYDGMPYAMMTNTKDGKGVFSRVLFMEQERAKINEAIRQKNAEDAEAAAQNDAQINDFTSKLSQYNLADAEAGASNAEQAISQINDLLSGKHSEQAKSNVLQALNTQLENSGLTTPGIDLEGLDEEALAALNPYKTRLEELSKKPSYQPMQEVGVFDLIGFNTKQADGKIDTYYGMIDDFIASIESKTAQTLTASDIADAQALDSQMNMNEIMAAASAKVWSKYDTPNKQAKLTDPEVEGNAHKPITEQEYQELLERNKQRREKVQAILTEYFRNRVGEVVLSGRMQSAYLQKERDILSAALRIIGNNELALKVEGVTVPKEDTVTDKNIADLNRAEKELISIKAVLWETGDIEKVRGKQADIVKAMFGDQLRLNLFEYGRLDYTEAYRYDTFKSEKGQRMAGMYTINYLHTLTSVDPRQYYKNYDASFAPNDRMPNFEQEMTTQMAYAFIKNPAYKWTEKAAVVSKIFPNVLTIRGLARTGKSTEVPSRIAKVFKAEHGRVPNVLVVAPNDHLKATHMNEIGQHAKVTFVFNDQISSVKDVSQFDFVIIDEASLLTEAQIYKGEFTSLIDNHPSKPFIFLGDDTQVVSVPEGEEAPNYVPAFSYTIKTPIMTFRYATGNQDIWNMEENVLKAITTNSVQRDIKGIDTVYSEDKTAGVQQFETEQEVKREFENDFERAEETDRKNFVLIVKNVAARDLFLSTTTNKSITKEHVRPIEYSVERDATTGEVINRPSIQGGRKPRVYIAIAEDKGDNNNVRAINTAIGRSSGFICMVGKGKSAIGDSIDIRMGDPEKMAEADRIKKQNHENRMEMFRSVAGTATAEKDDVPTQKIKDVFKKTKEATKSPDELSDDYVVNGEKVSRVHTIMSKDNFSSENAGSLNASNEGVVSAIMVGNAFDKRIEQIIGLDGNMAKTVDATITHFKNPQTAIIGGNKITASIELSNEDAAEITKAVEAFLNGEMEAGISRGKLIIQPIIHGVLENGTKYAGTLDLIWIKNGAVTKIDIKTYQPNAEGKVSSVTMNSWKEQMDLYEKGLKSMGVPSNDESLIFAFPIKRSEVKDRKIEVSLAGSPVLMPLEGMKTYTWKPNSSTGKDKAEEQTKKPEKNEQGKTEEEVPAVIVNEPHDNEQTNDYNGDLATVEENYSKNKDKGSAIMYGMSYFPMLTNDVALSGAYNKETSLHTKLIAFAMNKLNAEVRGGQPEVKLDFIENVLADKRFKNDSEKVAKALDLQKKYLPSSTTLQAITISVDPIKNAGIVNDMAKVFLANKGLVKGFKGSSIEDAVSYMQDNGFLVIGQLYSFNDKFGPYSRISLDQKQLFEKMAEMKTAYVRQIGITPSGQKTPYRGKVNLAEFAADIRSREGVGGKIISVTRDPKSARYFVHYEVIGTGSYISSEVEGINVIEGDVLHPDIAASIKSMKENKEKDGSEKPSKYMSFSEMRKSHVAFDTWEQNVSWFVNKAESKESGKIVMKPGMEKFQKFFTLRGSKGNLFVNPAIELKANQDFPTKEQLGKYFEEFFNAVIGTKKNNGKPLELSFGFGNHSVGDASYIPERYWKNIAVLSKTPAMPRISVDVMSVLTNKPAGGDTDSTHNIDRAFFSSGDARPMYRTHVSKESLPAQDLPEMTQPGMEDEVDEFGLVKKKRIYMATNSELYEAFGNNPDAVGFFIAQVAQSIRINHTNGVNIRTKINPNYNNISQVIFENLNKLKLAPDNRGVKLQLRDMIRDYENNTWSERSFFKGAESLWLQEVRKHERMWGDIVEERSEDGKLTITFKGKGLWDKVHDPEGGINTLTNEESAFYFRYMLTSDKYYYAAVSNIYPGFSPESDSLTELEVRYDRDYTGGIGDEKGYKRDYNSGHMSFDASNTMTKMILGYIRGIAIVENGKIRPVPVKKFQYLLLKAASTLNSVTPANMENTDLNSFYQALQNERANNPGSENARMIDAFENVFGIPYEIVDNNSTKFRDKIRSIYRDDRAVFTFYDMAYHTDIIADVLREEGAPAEMIESLPYRQKVAKQTIVHLANYVLSVNLKRMGINVYSSGAFRLKPLNALDNAEIERQLYDNLAKHVAYGDNGFYISNETQNERKNYEVKKTNNGYEFSFKGEQPYFTMDKNGEVSFRPGSEEVVFKRLNSFLQLGLGRNFYKAFTQASIVAEGRVIETGKAKIEKMLGHMSITLMNAAQKHELRDIDARIESNKAKRDARLDSAGRAIQDIVKWQKAIDETIAGLNEQKAKITEELKVTNALVKSFTKGNVLVSETIKKTVSDINPETEEIVEKEVQEKFYLPSGFVSYIKDIAHVESSVRSNYNGIAAFNGEGKRMSLAGQTSRLSKILPGTNVGSSFTTAQNSLNSKQWRDIPNNPISMGLFVIKDVFVNGGAKTNFTGKGFSGLTPKDVIQTSVDNFVESVIGDTTTVRLSLTPNGDSSEHNIVDVQLMENTKLLNYTIEKADGGNIKSYYITDKAWEIFGEATKALVNKANQYQQNSRNRYAQLSSLTSKASVFEGLINANKDEYDLVRSWQQFTEQLSQSDLNNIVKYARLVLVKDADYILEEDDQGNVVSFLPGNSLAKANVGIVKQVNRLLDQYNIESNPFEKKRIGKQIAKLKRRQPFWTNWAQDVLQRNNYSPAALREVFKNELFEHFNLMRRSARIHPGISKSFTNNKGEAQWWKKVKDDKYTYTDYNPVYEAHFFAHALLNMSVGDNAHGDLGQFTNVLKAGKRFKNLSSPGAVLATGDVVAGNIKQMSFVLAHDGPTTLVEDGNQVPLRTRDGKLSGNRSNGAIFYSPLAYIQIHRAMGSLRGNNGQLTKGPLKPVIIDKSDSFMRLFKHAGFVIDEHELVESPEMMAEFKRMTSNELISKFEAYRENLVNKNMPLVQATREALEMIVDEIEQNPDLNSQYIGAIVPIDALKTGIKGLVNWWSDIPKNNSALDYSIFGRDAKMDNLVVQRIDMAGFLTQQQASEKVESPDASFMAQFVETLGGLDAPNKDLLDNLNRLRAENIYEFWNVFNGMTENSDAAKAFVRNLALENFEGAEHETMSQYLLSNDANSLALPNIAPKVREYFRNYTNHKADKARISGMSAIQMPGWMRKVYVYNGSQIGARDLEKLRNYGVIDKAEYESIKYNAQPMRAFRKDNNTVVAGQIVAPFIHRQKLKLPEGVTPMDVFGLVYEIDGAKKFVDLRTLSATETADLLNTEGMTVIANVALGMVQQGPDYAQRVHDYVQQINQLNRVMLVRTPSGPSSAGWYDIVDWTEREYNMVYVPSEKSDVDSTDFDYDMIGVVSYSPELNKDDSIIINRNTENAVTVKSHLNNIPRRYNQMLDVISNIMFDNRNYDKLSEPIRLRGYEQLAEHRRDKSKFIIPHFFSAGMEIFKEFAAGGKIVGYEANNQKVLGVLLNAAHFIEGSLGSLNVTNNIRSGQYNFLGETNLGRMQNFVNLATDNPNLLALYGLNINQFTSGIYFAMLLNENNDLLMEAAEAQALNKQNPLNVGSIIDFMNKDHVRNFFQMIDASRSITQSSVDIITALNKRIEGLRGKFLVKQNTGTDVTSDALMEIEEGYTEARLEQFKNDLNELKRIKSKIENEGISYEEALGLKQDTSNFDQDLYYEFGIYEEDQSTKPAAEKKPKNKTSEEIAKDFYKKRASVSKDLAFVEEQIKNLEQDIFMYGIVERLNDFQTLLHYAKQAEGLRRLGEVVALNQGKPTEDKEVYRKMHSLRFIFGAELSDFLEGKTGTYNYMNYYQGLTEEEYKQKQKDEEEIRALINYEQLINAQPQLRAQIFSLNEQVKAEEKIFREHVPFVNNVMDKVLSLQGMDHFKYNDSYFRFMKEAGKFMKDMFYEHAYHYDTAVEKSKFDFISQQNAFLSQILPDYHFSYNGNYSVSNPVLQKLLAAQTIAVVEWLEKQIANPDSGVDISQAENNFFLANLKTGSNGFFPFIYAEGSMNMDEGVKGRLRDGFKSMGRVRVTINDQQYNIGSFLKTALEHYQFIQHGFDISRNSLNQVIQGRIFEEFSEFLKTFSSAYESNGTMTFQGVERSVMDISALAAEQIPLSSDQIVGISKKVAEQVPENKRPMWATKYVNEKPVILRKTILGDEYVYLNEQKNVFGPVGGRYVTDTVGGMPSNIVDKQKRMLLVQGTSLESFMNLVKGNLTVLNFMTRDMGFDTMTVERIGDAYVDGIPVEVKEISSTQLVVQASTKQGTILPLLGTLQISANKKFDNDIKC